MELFGTAGIRGDVRAKVMPELALAVGRAAGADGGEFVLGRDGRTTGGALADAMSAGLRSAGADVVRLGQVPTPAVGFASRDRRGVVVTASHNPPTDNGIKLFADGQEYDDDAEATVEARVEDDPAPVAWNDWGTSTNADLLGDYWNSVVEYARDYGAPLSDLLVAVDCGNGMASLATPQVLRELGADVHALHANVDGHFPGRESKPTPESLGDLREFVADGDADLGLGHDGDADLGLGHDGDADRIVVVDVDGEVVHEDTVLAILAERYVRASTVEDPVVVTTPNASGRIDERVEAAGGRVERVRLGALHVGIADARREGTDETSVAFAAEPWKHIHTRFGGWIDAVASAAVFSRLVADEGLAALRESVTERPYRKTEVRCPDEAKAATMDLLTERLPDTFPEAGVDTEHGVRLTFDDGGWVLVRPSGTEPYVRLYVESDDVDALLEEVRDVMEAAVADTNG